MLFVVPQSSICREPAMNIVRGQTGVPPIYGQL